MPETMKSMCESSGVGKRHLIFGQTRAKRREQVLKSCIFDADVATNFENMIFKLNNEEIKNGLSILVAGGAGFLGSHHCDRRTEKKSNLLG